MLKVKSNKWERLPSSISDHLSDYEWVIKLVVMPEQAYDAGSPTCDRDGSRATTRRVALKRL